MRVLEINGFTERATNYDGHHEVKRLLMGRAQNRSDEERNRLGGLLQSESEAAAFQPEVIICRALGRSYGNPAWKRPLKYVGERRVGRKVMALKARLGVPLGVVDSTDDLMIHPANRDLLSGCDRYFKRELAMDPFMSLGGFESSRFRRPERKRRLDVEGEGWLEKLEPLTLGLSGEVPGELRKPFGVRQWDIFYVGDGAQRPLRGEVQVLLDALEQKGLKVYRPTERLGREEYFAEMGNARAVLSPPGFGWDCHRHYEAALMGCVVVMSFPNIRRQLVLEQGVSGLYYDPCSLSGDEIGMRLRNLVDLEEIAQRGCEQVEKHGSHAAIFADVVRLLSSC